MLNLEAKFTKNGEQVQLPMHPQLVELMTEWLLEAEPGMPLLPGFAKKKAWLMVRKDLEHIHVPYHTKDGTADYHAIGRCSCITQLLVNGVPIHQTMKPARHHSIEMTQRYAKVRQDEVVAALKKLPPAPISGQWKSQRLKGNKSPTESRCIPKTAIRPRDVKSSRVGRSVPQRARMSSGGDLSHTPLISGGGGNRIRRSILNGEPKDIA